MTEERFDELWHEIERHFDWAKVHRVMKTLGWKWSTQGTPSILQMKEHALRLSRDLLMKKEYRRATALASGGFRVEKYKEGKHERLRLEFIAEWCDADY
jgi:hypothetical protein